MTYGNYSTRWIRLPFHEKDLDAAAEEYLISAVREIGTHRSKLILHLPTESASQERDTVALAIRHYFAYRARHTGEQLRLMLGRGLISCAIGLAFLFVCLSIRQLFASWGGTANAEILSEGLLILGWVAMWRPIEIFLYDWWPELGKRRLYNRIASMPIDTRPLSGAGSVVGQPLAEPHPLRAVSTGVSHAPDVLVR